MQSWSLSQPNGLSSLINTNLPPPITKDNEVQIKVHAVGLNPIDYKLTYWGYATWNYPQIIGLDIAGVIEQVGKKISTFKVGDRVFGFLDPRQAGGFAEYVCCKPASLSHIPPHVLYSDAAALPCAGFTAWIALKDKLRLPPNSIIAITGAGGGVGGFAVQLAKIMGLTVYAIAETHHHRRLLGYGADAVIDPNDNVGLTIFELTEARLLDAVIDCVSSKTASIMSALIRYNGQLVMIADQFQQIPILATTKAISIHEVALHGTYAHGTLEHIQHLSMVGEQLMTLLENHQLNPMIDKIFPFSELPQGLNYLKQNHHQGKVVVSLIDDLK
ncbi:zinc-binding dehydrogenase [Photobacterium damselae subsp. damselae]|uniref:alcohol dehydrogenase catalytic domain-containing protein n=1 Tax=Photobacterium damselae TaxID=38293 RepID=UPI00311B3336